MARRVFAVAARAVVVPAAAAGAPAQAQAHQAAVPYAVISHSMGCWVAFEFLKLVQASGELRVWCVKDYRSWLHSTVWREARQATSKFC